MERERDLYVNESSEQVAASVNDGSGKKGVGKWGRNGATRKQGKDKKSPPQKQVLE